MSNNYKILGIATLVLGGCMTLPTGPRVTVMPAPGKPFELFVQEDKICRQFAAQSIGKSAQEAGNEAFANTAVAGAAIGAVAGGLLSGGQPESAASGAGMGLLTGSMIGADAGKNSSYDAQYRYDIAYEQCMYTKGNQLPGQHFSNPSYPPPPPR